jgi:hypothetical protein
MPNRTNGKFHLEESALQLELREGVAADFLEL